MFPLHYYQKTTCHDKKHQCGELLKHGVQPLVLEGNGDPQEVDDDPCKVDVADHHNVEMTEELKLLQTHGCLPISSGSILKPRS